ncbi:helix-turn-helix domain-containing protein [Oxalobacter vibrioformis]|uniref:Helix-turn-helix domain-containing protein n=1 Tax=Oxalobacter vibrioformis TaxID=933080 RepID=A0A9E9LYU2_9BURK|nr:helix-turn-helix domain-containing protein [Oxalobacter vibrioformis]WAW09753.1 helix-turn-helix domain-containing protein [Oxalobacter vibrioformis]
MSFKVMTWASRQKVGGSSAKALLLVMANLADDQGICYPSQRYLSEVLEQNIKTVQKNIKFLQENGFLVDTGKRVGGTKSVIVYQLSMSKAPPKTDELNTPKVGVPPKTEYALNYPEAPPILPRSTPKNGVRTQKEYKGNRDSAARGTRLPDDWQPSEEMISYCRQKRPDLDPHEVGERFRDFWLSKPGKDGRKADWAATWRNWVRNERQGTATPSAANVRPWELP